MKKMEMCQRINRNNTTVVNDLYNNPLSVNVIEPEIAGNDNWEHHDVATGVDIIEIDNSNVSDTSEETPRHNMNHAWSYANSTFKPPDQVQNNNRVNRKAREKRRLKNDRQSNAFYPSEYVPTDKFSDSINVASNYKSNVRLNHQINCFTIINKHFTNSDSSSEKDYDSTEESRPIGDGLNESQDFNNIFGEEMVTYNSDCEAEKRTIWIYSFKNKRLLTDDYMELVNIPSTETESCTSFTFEKIEEDTDNITRAASPIPPPYIPRLNLSLGQTLSTVTEVTEPNKQPSSVETERQAKVPVLQKQKNTWFLNNCNDTKDDKKQEKSTNILNWMALSPRERRRAFRDNSNSDIVYNGKLGTLKKVCPIAETKIINDQNHSKQNETYNVIHSSTVDVVVHVRTSISSETIDADSKSDRNSNQINTNHVEAENMVQELADDENMQDVIKSLHKPQIKISQKSINSRIVTEPLEKLNTDNWIVEESEEQKTVYSYDLEKVVDEDPKDANYTLTVKDRIWSKNTLALMKPAQWDEYAPITDSHLSLHLSLDTTISKQTWISRLINLFKCCN